MHKVIIYTDGAAQGNPGRGGYGVVMMSGDKRKEISHGYRLTTNNRMELLSVIVALEALKKDGMDITIYSDSKYVVDAVNKHWVFGWVKKGFKGKKNVDLWKRFLIIYALHKPKFVWVKGHASNKENERCDELAVAAAQGSHLSVDTAYENNKD
ncbi:MAG TPA: ribonuclease HI [Bacteroidia bacterium]|jgi:ribonuclease HI|nr:ribonuclease HI [Bacteroidia bacterium]